ncbi:hypothetical protein BH23CHL2_BH23CHL2_13640 [soil metagenome]
MAARITGLTKGVGPSRFLAVVRSWSKQRRAVVGAVSLLVVLAACSSTGTYPVDLFSAMHYQHSYRTLEPPRFLAPEGAVPVDGRAPRYSASEITELENPATADEASIALGQQVYQVNCAVCHGETGDGNGLMSGYLTSSGANPPADLTAERLEQVPDNHIYNVVVNGLGQWMPAFGELIPGEQIWHLTNYIRSLQAAQ